MGAVEISRESSSCVYLDGGVDPWYQCGLPAVPGSSLCPDHKRVDDQLEEWGRAVATDTPEETP